MSESIDYYEWVRGLKKDLDEYSQDIPIEWDRVIDAEDYLVFYGWIKKNGKRDDFVVIQYLWEEEGCSIIYITSSAKYTEKLHTNISKKPPEEGHNICVKFEDFFKKALEIDKNKKR